MATATTGRAFSLTKPWLIQPRLPLLHETRCSVVGWYQRSPWKLLNPVIEYHTISWSQQGQLRRKLIVSAYARLTFGRLRIISEEWVAKISWSCTHQRSNRSPLCHVRANCAYRCSIWITLPLYQVPFSLFRFSQPPPTSQWNGRKSNETLPRRTIKLLNTLLETVD